MAPRKALLLLKSCRDEDEDDKDDSVSPSTSGAGAGTVALPAA